MDVNEFIQYDALALAELVRDKEVTAEELVDVVLARIDAINPSLNAVVVRRDAKVRMEAESPHRGVFAGVPFLVKDMDGVLADEPNTHSSRSLADWRPNYDSELFARYKRAGLLIAGKTNAPEFGIFAVTESELRGPCRNPWNTDHTPGGSSGGSAAAVASRIVPIAHAGDGGGSIRIPASSCGIFGLKPTRGRMPLGPDVGEGWDGFIQPHAVSISVRDSAALLDATHGADSGAPYAEPPAPKSFLAQTIRRPGKLRIGYSTRAMLATEMHGDNVAAVHDVVILLRSLGHELVEVDLPLDRETLTTSYLTIVAACVGAEVLDTEEFTGVKPKAEMFELETWFMKQVGDALSATQHESARTACHRLGRQIASLFDEYKLDVHLSATTAQPPVRIGETALNPLERLALSGLRRASTGAVLRTVLDQMAQTSLSKTPNTQVYNMTGQPAMSVPLWWNQDNLPIGVQFGARFGDEATLFRLAAQLEEARPWADKRPDIATV